MEEKQLDPEIYLSIRNLCAKGDKLASAGAFSDAMDEYGKAWELLPVPENQWSASTWILAAIADAAFLGDYKISAREALEYAMTCPGAIGNPFLHLRYGQVLLDAGEEDRAADELIRAYMGAGAEIFSSEDPYYLSFLRTKAVI